MWLDGSYVAPMRVIPGGIRGQTHLAQIRLGTELVTAYVKAFEASRGRWLFNEVAGGLLARRAGIGAPAGGLIWVPLAVLQMLFPDKVFAHHNAMTPCFASAPISQGPGLAAVGLGETTGNVLEEIRKFLSAWPGLGACVAFDEWVGNTDRHANNVLLAAGGRLVPIDHSDCFGGPEALDDFSCAQSWYQNTLLESVLDPDQLPLPTKAALIHAAERLVNCHRESVADIESLRPWLGDALGLHWAEWLQIRAANTAQWLRERVRMLV